MCAGCNISRKKCQQDELYAAEEVAPRGATFSSPDEIQAWVDGLRDTWWWQLWYSKVIRVEVYHQKRYTSASVGWFEEAKGGGVVDMLPVHWNQLYVLHELSHVLAQARYGSRSHDPWFARVYLELVSLALPDSYLPLFESFTRSGIKFDIDLSDDPLRGIPLGPAAS